MVHTVQIKILNRIDQTHKNSARKKKKKKGNFFYTIIF